MKSMEEKDQIAAYVSGTMHEKELADFERLLESDKVLRREVDTWREAVESARQWIEEEPPGLARADELETPLLKGSNATSSASGTARVFHLRPVLRRVLAAAAIFVAGLFIGSQVFPGGQGAGQGPTHGQKIVSPRPTPAAPRRLYREGGDGRLVFETALMNSGSRAVWVVDGNFRLANLAGGR